MVYWFSKKKNGNKDYKSKCLSFNFYPQHYKSLFIKNNGAIKGVDNCYDLNIWLFGLHVSYTNFDYNR